MWHEFFVYLGKHDSVIVSLLLFLGGVLTFIASMATIRDKAAERQEKRDEEKHKEEEARHKEEEARREKESQTEVSTRVLTGAMEIDAINRAILSAIPSGLVVANQNLIIERWNDEACALLGWTENDAVGKSVQIIIPENMRAAHRAGFARYQETGEAHIIGTPVNLAAQHKNGRLVGVTLCLSEAHKADGTPIYIGVIIPQTVSVSQLLSTP